MIRSLRPLAFVLEKGVPRRCTGSRMKLYVPLVREFAARVGLLHTAVAARLGLHVTDRRGLRLLGKGAMSAGDLAEQTGLSGAAVTALIDRLENAGYVIRERGTDDRRRVTVYAVPEKLREVERLYEGQGASMSKLLAKYSPEEFSVIADFLKHTAQVLAGEAKKLQGRARGTAWQHFVSIRSGSALSVMIDTSSPAWMPRQCATTFRAA